MTIPLSGIGVSGDGSILVPSVIPSIQDAIDFCESRGMKPELAWSYSDMSELVDEIDDDAEASQQLVENALAIANDIGMKPLINRILARREILKA